MAEKKKGFDLAEKLKEVSKMDIGSEQRPQLEYIDIDLIDPDPDNRKIDKIEEMIQNLHLVGLLQPLEVRPDPDHEGRYIAVSGHRRREAIKRMVADGEEDWRRVPCLVDPLEDSPAMRRLKLLSGNIVSQELTSAEMAKAAKDMEDCIYQLQEEGHEFPGKIRDYVANACGIAGSRVGRLKVIRERLYHGYTAEWETGKLPESTASVIAHFPRGFQERLYRVLSNLPGHASSAGQMERVLKKREEGWDWNPCLTCPDGKSCKRGDVFLRRDCSVYGSDPICGGKTCCLECELAKRDWYPCEQMCSKAKAARKEKNDAKKEKEKREQEKALKRNQRITQQNAQRLLRAIEAAGLGDEKKIPWTDWWTCTVKGVREWAEGEFSQYPLRYGPELEPKSCSNAVKVAKLLGVSTDWVLGVTDDLTSAPASITPETQGVSAPVSETAAPEDPPESPAIPPSEVGKWVFLEWIPAFRKPEPGQLVAMRFDLEDAKGFVSVGWWRDGQWRFKAGTPMGRDPVGWFPLPPINVEVPTLGTGEEGDDHD